jgi:hypothetical protein
LYGEVKTPTVRGFDLALVPAAAPRLFGTPPPRVLMKVIDTADVPALNEAWSHAARARVHAGRSPVAVLLFAKHLAPPQELKRALATLRRQPRHAEGPAEIAVVVIDRSDLKAHVPDDASAAVRTLVDAIGE